MNLLFCFSLALLICFTKSQMTEEKRKSLLKKVTKRVEYIDKNIFSPLNEFYEDIEITYDPEKITKIINENKFPQNFNFIEEYKAPIYMKDQKSCGSCWAFAATTALAYRYHKLGISVNLSPQNMLSCHIQDCDAGYYLLDSQFYLVKNGTVTEECEPFSSSNGVTTTTCPIKCKDGKDMVKYYAKNSYATTFDYDTEEYYDVVTVIMDQLINYGPVASGIVCYDDFSSLSGGKSCSNTIYKRGENANYRGGHAITIVGYGYQDSKYYWLIQNSWGESFCDNGFAKVEFAQINIENVAFSEPYIESDDTSVKQISAKMTVQEDCKISYTTDNNNYEDSFELYFKNTNSNDDFYYQCGKDPSKKVTQGICSFDFESFNMNEKGYYKYLTNSPLKKQNTFNLDFSSLSQNQIYFYGADLIEYLNVGAPEYYVSREGSQILLGFLPYNEDTKLISKIYPNKNNNNALSNCKKVTDIEIDIDLIQCKMNSNEINYFQQNDQSPLAYDILCGEKEETGAIVHELDTTKYPVFRVKELILPEEGYIDKYISFSLIVDIEGSISGFRDNDNENAFTIYINIIKNGAKTGMELICMIPKPSYLESDFEIDCFSYLDKRFYYDNVYLAPYYSPMETKSPFEVIINSQIKATDPKEDNPTIYRTDSQFIRMSLFYVLILIFLE